MKLARAIHFDESGQHVFHNHAETEEWCISGEFEFPIRAKPILTGNPDKRFLNCWFGLSTLGRVTFVAVAQIEASEIDRPAQGLGRHFVQYYRALSIDAGQSVTRQEMLNMADLGDENDPSTLLTVALELGKAGVHENYRVIAPQDADLIN